MKTEKSIPQAREQEQDVIVLGVASTDTHGPGAVGEITGILMVPASPRTDPVGTARQGAPVGAPLAAESPAMLLSCTQK